MRYYWIFQHIFVYSRKTYWLIWVQPKRWSQDQQLEWTKQKFSQNLSKNVQDKIILTLLNFSICFYVFLKQPIYAVWFRLSLDNSSTLTILDFLLSHSFSQQIDSKNGLKLTFLLPLCSFTLAFMVGEGDILAFLMLTI